jgi:hypothetical protein
MSRYVLAHSHSRRAARRHSDAVIFNYIHELSTAHKDA